MTRKRCTKLLMGLGMEKHDVEKIIETGMEECGGETYEHLFNWAFFRWAYGRKYHHPAYQKKADEVFKGWLYDGKDSGKTVQLLGRYYMATRDMITIDLRKAVKVDGLNN